MRYKELMAYLWEETKKLEEGEEDSKLTADEIALYFQIKRNTVSSQCNSAVKAGEVIKIQTRPVFFIHRKAFAEKFFMPDKLVYDSWRELWNENLEPIPQILPGISPKKDESDRQFLKLPEELFEEIIGYNGSLRKAIEQLKISFIYPTNKLPVILTGSTGVGKTFLVEMIYKYAKKSGMLPENAPFITFNCAQYADNPELLSSNLFGYIKGAFTGAHINTKGVIAAADGGVLFLDEVHRLNRESQEKLFTLMDQGCFRRVGESEEWHKVNVRLIMATTENLHDNFLETFLRRIPIQIQIPALRERGFEERLKLIYYFFIQESRVINRALLISGKVIDALLYFSSISNIGTLKNQIKLISAAAYMKFYDEKCLKINLVDLPERDLKNIIGMHKLSLYKNADLYITPEMETSQIYHEHVKLNMNGSQLLNDLEDIYNVTMEMNLGIQNFEQQYFEKVNQFFNNLLYVNSSDSQNMVIQFIIESITDVNSYMKHHYNMQFKGNSIYAVAAYLYTRNSIYEVENQQYVGLNDYIEKHCKKQNILSKKILGILKDKIDINFTYEDEYLFTLYFKSQFQVSKKLKTQCIILAHGYATANSIANTANQLIGENIFDAFDMAIDAKTEDAVSYIRNYLTETDITKGLIILVDMGSLQKVYEPLRNMFQGPVVIVNNVSTQLALDVGFMIKSNEGVDNIIEKIKQYYKLEYEMIYPENKRPKCFLSCCITGVGGSQRINELLQRSIADEFGYKVVVGNYEELRNFKEKHNIFRLYDVKYIIGTANPKIAYIPYIPLEELISGQIEKLKKYFSSIATIQQLKKISDNLVRELSVERLIGLLTILNPEKVVKQINECINMFIEMTGYSLSVSKQAGIYFHVSCMIERLIRGQPIEIDVDRQECEISDHMKSDVYFVKKAFASIESYYNIKNDIPEQEWYYITSIIMRNEEQ